MPILQFDRIIKRFPGVTALDEVSFSIESGECHALMGENGAGKSTLGKIIAGIYRPDGGRLILDGQEVAFRSPLDAARAGISIVHQELAFCSNLSVAENLCLADIPHRRGLVRWPLMRDRARRMLDTVGLDLDPSTPMSVLSTAQEQMCQIALAVGRGARVVIMDEPTSSLSQAEAGRLFDLMRSLSAAGVTIIYVSHRLEEIIRLSDRISVLRDGRHIRTLETANTTTDEVVRLMIGRPVAEYDSAPPAARAGPVVLSVEGLTSPGRFADISFTIRAGEIVGLAGLVGAGRSEIARAVFGIDPIDRGVIRLDGLPLEIRNPPSAIRKGIGLLPEDRKRQGLVLSMTCKENLSLAFLETLRRGCLLDHRRDRALAGDYCGRLRVRTPGIDASIAGLSGGNQQKIALAKWLARDCRVLILDEPTRGVDIGAKAEIHALIDRLAADGKAVLLISSELPELISLSTRILVIAQGRIAGELPRRVATQEALMRLMAGMKAA